MTLCTPASRAASSTFRVPVTFTAFVVSGSWTERGTDGSAASCRTASQPRTAWCARSKLCTSPSSISGPVPRDGVSQFPIYHDLGAGIWQGNLDWHDTTPTRPANPRDPNDPAYHWPPSLDQAVSEASRYHIRISLLVMSTPAWANGGRPYNWVPTRISDYTDFLTAAARRYPSVHLWMIWGEPSRRANFMPLTPARQGATRLT